MTNFLDIFFPQLDYEQQYFNSGPVSSDRPLRLLKNNNNNNNNNNFNSNILVRFFRNYLQTIYNL